MFNENAFLNDKLVAELQDKGVIGQPTDDNSPVVGFILLNHSRNVNTRVSISPKKKIPTVGSGLVNQNPTAFVDQYRGTVNACLTHAEKFIISCADAPANFHFATSFGQMLAELYRSNQNIQIIVNGNVHASNEFIRTQGTTRTFDPTFLNQYGLSYTDALGNYKLQAFGVNTNRFELRVYSANNTMTPAQVQTLFGQADGGDNGTVVYHSNTDFYGFTFCIESTSIPSVTKIDYASIETMDELIANGAITSFNNDANNLAIETTTPGSETALAAGFNARLLNEFEETPIRKQDYLLVLEAEGIDVNQIDMTKITAKYDVMKKSTSGGSDETIALNIQIPNNRLFRVNSKIVHPLTMTENDNNQYLNFDIDFDGNEGTFLESQHKLDIGITKQQDVTIPLLVDYPTSTPQNISNLSFAVFDRYRYYQFAMDVAEKSVLYVETLDMNSTDIEISIANRAPGVEQQSWRSNLNATTGANKAWYFAEETFVVVQLRVPIGLTGNIMLDQLPVAKPYLGCSVNDGGVLTRDGTNTMHILNYTGQDRLVFGKPPSGNIGGIRPVVQLFDEVALGKAIAFRRNEGVVFAQGVSEVRDYRIDQSIFVNRTGNNGAWLYTNMISKNYTSREKAASTAITMPPDFNSSLYDIYTIFELVNGGIKVHYYVLDSNLVPLTYLGNSMIPWLYDETKPVSVLSMGMVDSIGTGYDVSPGDLGPLRSDFIMSHNYDIFVTDVTEV